MPPFYLGDILKISFSSISLKPAFYNLYCTFFTDEIPTNGHFMNTENKYLNIWTILEFLRVSIGLFYLLWISIYQWFLFVMVNGHNQSLLVYCYLFHTTFEDLNLFDNIIYTMFLGGFFGKKNIFTCPFSFLFSLSYYLRNESFFINNYYKVWFSKKTTPLYI